MPSRPGPAIIGEMAAPRVAARTREE